MRSMLVSATSHLLAAINHKLPAESPSCLIKLEARKIDNIEFKWDRWVVLQSLDWLHSGVKIPKCKHSIEFERVQKSKRRAWNSCFVSKCDWMDPWPAFRWIRQLKINQMQRFWIWLLGHAIEQSPVWTPTRQHWNRYEFYATDIYL